MESQDLDHWDIPAYIQAIKKLELKRCLSKMKMETLGNMVCEFKEFQSQTVKGNETQTSAFEDILKTYGLTFHQIVKDGNCFFTAIATNILCDINSWKNILIQSKVCGDQSLTLLNVETLRMNLRQKFVEELLGTHRKIYENFTSLNCVDYEAECMKFLQDGFFANAIGDIMPIATATALQISIVVFTDSSPHLMYVNPAVGKAELSAFLIYHTIGVGHYSNTIWSDICTRIS